VTLLGAIPATGSMPTTEPASVSIIMSRFDTYSVLSVVIKVKGPDIYIPPITKKPEQQIRYITIFYKTNYLVINSIALLRAGHQPYSF